MMFSGSVARLLTRRGAGVCDLVYSCASVIAINNVLKYKGLLTVIRTKGDGEAQAATLTGGRLAGVLLALAVAGPVSSCAADAAGPQDARAPPGFPATAGTGPPSPSTSGSGGAEASAPPPLTNHPLEYDPVTNEHTAKMTMARTSALEYYNAGKYTQAEAKFREALAEAQLGFEPGDAHIASAKNNLAEFLRNTGRWDEAEALYKEALDLLERNFTEKHWLYVSALHNLALSYEARGDLPAARATMERVLGLRLAMFGPRHFLYADSLYALGHMLRVVPGQAAAGLEMMSEAVRTLEEAEKLQVGVALHWLTEIASCHTADGHPDAAAAALRRAVGHLAQDRGHDAAAASALNEQLVDALAGAGRAAEAAEAAGEALAARRKMFGEGALVVAQSELRVAQLELLAAQTRQSPATTPSATADSAGDADPGVSPAVRALSHAEAAANISAANVEEASKGSLLSGPPPEKLLKRLRAAHTLGSAAKLVATLAGVANPAAVAAAAAAAATPPPSTSAPAAAAAAPPSSSRKWSWWPFGGGRGASHTEQGPSKEAVSGQAGQGQGAQATPPQSARHGSLLLPPVQPVVGLERADLRLEQAAAVLASATAAGRDLMVAVGSGRRKLPPGVSPDDVASLMVEVQLQLLDVLERLGLVLQARVAAGEGAAAGAAGQRGGSGTGGDVVARHRRVLEQQERVAAELLG